MQMPRTVPADTDLLCESCGYTLNGLPESGRCPECGAPVIESTTADGRRVPEWEIRRGPREFLATSSEVIFRPTRFYRTLATRHYSRSTLFFADIHWAIASLLFGLAGFFHLRWMITMGTGPIVSPWWVDALVYLSISVGSFIAITATTWLAAKLSAWEGAYHGMRLPLPTVRRGMDYHAAHYLPVALIAAATVIGYQILLRLHLLTVLSAQRYLYVLSIEVIAAAGYLFKTYWIAMRQMMYANR